MAGALELGCWALAVAADNTIAPLGNSCKKNGEIKLRLCLNKRSSLLAKLN
jgi:hypothetical protein